MSDEYDESKKEVAKIETEHQQVDSFAGYNDDVEGVHNDMPVGVIKGTLLKFSNDFRYVLRDDSEFDTDTELVVVEVVRIVQKWIDGEPAETIILDPGQPFPDLKALNNAAPPEEWVEKFGQKRGPWQAQQLLYLLNPKTMDHYTFATGTIGGGIAVRDVVNRTNWFRKLRGNNFYPVILLSSKFMPTAYQGRDRPHFIVKRFITLGGDDGAGASIEAPKGGNGGDQIEPPVGGSFDEEPRPKKTRVGESSDKPERVSGKDFDDDVPF
jgi:hypothetical protein